MSGAAGETAATLPSAFDFGRFTTLTDVGGGEGTLLAGVLTAHPGLAGVVFDTAQGLTAAPHTLARHGLERQCTLIAGDFFRSVPDGSDLYLMKSVLHDWTGDQAVTILSHCRNALPPRGLILIKEPVLPETAATSTDADTADGAVTYPSDPDMLVNVGGRERTRKDFEEVCHRAGLTLTSVTPLTDAAPFSPIEPSPADRSPRNTGPRHDRTTNRPQTEPEPEPRPDRVRRPASRPERIRPGRMRPDRMRPGRMRPGRSVLRKGPGAPLTSIKLEVPRSCAAGNTRHTDNGDRSTS